MMRSMVIPTALVALLVVPLASAVAAGSEAEPPPLDALLEKLGVQRPKTPAVAPPFVLPDLDGNEVALGRLRGRVVLLYFWTTW